MISTIEDTNILSNWKGAGLEASGSARWSNDGAMPVFYSGTGYVSPGDPIRAYLPQSYPYQSHYIHRQLKSDQQGEYILLTAQVGANHWVGVGDDFFPKMKFRRRQVDTLNSGKGSFLVLDNIAELESTKLGGKYKLKNWDIKCFFENGVAKFWSEQEWEDCNAQVNGRFPITVAGYKWPDEP